MKYKINEQICTMCLHDKYIYMGAYSYESKERSGGIFVLKNLDNLRSILVSRNNSENEARKISEKSEITTCIKINQETNSTMHNASKCDIKKSNNQNEDLDSTEYKPNLLNNETMVDFDKYFYKIIDSNGVFKLISYNNFIYACCSKEIIKISGMQIIKIIKNDFLNTNISINEYFIFVTQDNGDIGIYDHDLCFITNIHICNHILWSICAINEYIYIGCDCGRIFKLEKRVKLQELEKSSKYIESLNDNKNTSIIRKTNLKCQSAQKDEFDSATSTNFHKAYQNKKEHENSKDYRYTLKKLDMKRSSSITVLKNIKNKVFIGSYDTFIDILCSDTDQIIKKMSIDSTVWDIFENNSKFYVLCMYDGLKKYDSQYNFCKEYKSEDLVYAGCVFEDLLIFSDFYEKNLNIRLLYN